MGVAIVNEPGIWLRCDPSNLTLGENTMTASTIALAELAEKGSGIDALRQMVAALATASDATIEKRLAR